MNKELRRIHKHRSALIVGLLGVSVYVALFLLFIGLMAINNWQIRHASRTLGTVLLTYSVMQVVMMHVYGGYDVGRKKNKPVISSMWLSAVITDLVTYLQLQIMNVNTYNNRHLMLFGRDFPYLLLCIALQSLVIVFFVRIGNDAFFKMNPPKKTLLIVHAMEDAAHVLPKIMRYRLQWSVEQVIEADDPHIEQAIQAADTVIMGALPPDCQMNLLRCCYRNHRDVLAAAVLENILFCNARQVVVDDAPFLAMDYYKMTLAQRVIKRGGDMLISALMLILFSPLLAVIALLIHLDDHGPVLFKQERMTVNGRIFRICKFRTMSIQASGEAEQKSATEADQRITRVGHWLRRWRLDELPQFWNILRGDMTIVGPRPEMLDNISRYKQQLPAFAYREKMKAGLTGYAQIEGRYNTTPEDKLMLDLMYIEHFSIWLDIKLIFRTLTVFFKSDSTKGFAAEQTEAPERRST